VAPHPSSIARRTARSRRRASKRESAPRGSRLNISVCGGGEEWLKRKTPNPDDSAGGEKDRVGESESRIERRRQKSITGAGRSRKRNRGKKKAVTLEERNTRCTWEIRKGGELIATKRVERACPRTT